MKIKIIKDSAKHIAKQYGLKIFSLVDVEYALIDTDERSIKFVYTSSDHPADLMSKTYPLKSEDGMIVADVAYYNNFS